MFDFFISTKIVIVWLQKISIPPPQMELEILRGWGSKTQEILEGSGAGWSIYRAVIKFLSSRCM